MPSYLCYAITQNIPGRTTRPVVAFRIHTKQQADEELARPGCEAIEPHILEASSAKFARSEYRRLYGALVQ